MDMTIEETVAVPNRLLADLAGRLGPQR